MAEKQATLDEIIAELEKAPEKVKDRVDKHEKARSTYTIADARPPDYKASIKELGNFLKHHSMVVDGVAKPDHHLETEAHDLLVAYGRAIKGKQDLDEKEAIKVALRYAKGGKLARILDFYRDNEQDKEEDIYVRAVVNRNVEPLNRKQHLQIAQDYIDKYKHILGDRANELELMKPEELVHQAKGLLLAHRENYKVYKEQIAKKREAD